MDCYLYGQHSRTILTPRMDPAHSGRQSLIIFHDNPGWKRMSGCPIFAAENEKPLCLTQQHRTVNNVVAISCVCSDVSCLQSQSLCRQEASSTSQCAPFRCCNSSNTPVFVSLFVDAGLTRTNDMRVALAQHQSETYPYLIGRTEDDLLRQIVDLR